MCYADVSNANAMTACVAGTHIRRRVHCKCYGRMRGCMVQPVLDEVNSRHSSSRPVAKATKSESLTPMGARWLEHQQGAKQGHASLVAIDDEVADRPDRHAPEERVPGDAQDALHRERGHRGQLPGELLG